MSWPAGYCQAYRRNPPGSRTRGGTCFGDPTWHIAFRHVKQAHVVGIVICDDCLPSYLTYAVEMSATHAVTWTPAVEYLATQS